MKLVHTLFKLFAGQPASRAPSVARAPLMLALEPRIVYEASVAAPAAHHAETGHHHVDSSAETNSAAVPGEGVTPGSHEHHRSQQNQQNQQNQQSQQTQKTQQNAQTQSTATTPATDTSAASASPEKQVVFIDSNVTDYQELITGLPAGTVYVVLNPNTDGLAQIAQYLEQHPGVQAIHLLSHGSEGQVQAGSTVLDSADLSQYSAELAQIGAAMAPGGDFLIYGCDVAAGSDGRTLVQQIAAATHLNVAASTDLTGAASLGGDWTLEYEVGDVKTPVVFSQAAEQGYDYLLTQTVESFTNADDSGYISGTSSSSFTLDGITYSITKTGANADNLVTTDSNLQLLADENGSDNALLFDSAGIGGISAVTITMADGKAFNIASLDFDGVADANITFVGALAGGGTASVSATSNGGAVTQTVGLSTANSAFADVTSLTIEGSNLVPTLGHIVYSEVTGPTVTTTSGTTTFTSHDSTTGTPVTVDSGLTVTDTEASTLTSATVQISSNYHSTEDSLAFTNTSATTYGNISALFSAGTLTLSSSGNSATLSQWQAALDAVTYIDTAADPNTSARTITFTGSDSLATGTGVAKTVNVDSPPIVTASNGTTSYVAGASAATVDSGASVTDPSQTTQASATVTISSGYDSGHDVLSFSNTSSTTFGNISGSYSNGVLTLTSSGANATDAQWTHALEAVAFSSTSTTHGNRTISFAVNDGATNSVAATKTVDVIDAPPVVTTTGGTTSYVGGTTGVHVDGGVTVSDFDNTTQASGTVTITSGFDSSHDTLSFTNTDSTQFGNITASYSGGVLTLTSSSASATDAQWANAFDAVTFSSTSTTYGNRTISFVVNDGTDNSTAATKTVDVLAPPTVTADSGSAAFVAGDNVTSTPVAVDSGLSLSDGGASAFASATVAITGNFHSGEDVLSFSNTSNATFGNIASSYNSGTGVLTLTSSSASATTAQWQAALDAVKYTDIAVTPNNSTRTISFTATDSNGNTSNTATRTVTVADTDQTPIVTTTGGTTSYIGGATAVTVDGGVTVSDLDNTSQSSGTVSITGSFHSGDTLSFTNTSNATFGNIASSYNSGTGVLTLTSSSASATDAQWASAFEAVKFSSTSTTYGNRTVSFVVNDGTNNSTAATKTVDVTNPDPVVTTDPGSAAFTAGDNVTSTPVAVDSGLTLTDPGTSTIASATVAITGSFVSGEDVLSFTNTSNTTFGNIASSYNSGTGVLTLTSASNSATLSQWQAALDAVKYTDTAITPNNSTRTVSFSVTDGNGNTSSTATRTVTVADIDQTPVVSTTGGTTNYVGGTGTVTIDGSVTVSDRDNTTQSSGAVSITSGFHSGDTLSFTNTDSTQFSNITGSYNSGTGVLTLSSAGAVASDAQWAHAFSAITFSAGASATPGNRTISFVVNDGIENSAAAIDTVDVLGPPTVTASSGSAAFTAGDNVTSTPVAVDSGISLSDGSASTFASATVAITGNFHSGEDVLSFTNNGSTMGNIAESYNAATGVLTLTSASASATTAQWQAALDAVKYTDIAVTPNNSTRTVSFTATDSIGNVSNTASRTVTVTDTDQTPIVGTTGGTTNYVGGTTAVHIDSGVTVSDLDNTTMSTGTVSITSGFHSGDTLSFTNTSSPQFGNITATYNSGTGVLTLTSVGATSSTLQWAHAFSAITFSAGASATPGNRTISFVVNDGIKNSAAATDTVDVLGPPTVTASSGPAAFTAGDNVASTPVAVDAGLSLSDGSASTFASATVAITGNFHSGEDVLSFTNTSNATFGNIAGSYNATTGVLTLTSSSASATTAQWQAALDAVQYTDTAITPNNSTRTVSFTATDSNGNASNTGTRTVTVADTYQTPVVTTSAGATAFTAGDNVTSTPVAVDPGLTVTDLSTGTLGTATVSIAGGFHGSEDSLIFANDGASMGNITGSYNAGTGVLSLSSPGLSATLAQWRAALDSILYTDSAITPAGTARTISFTVNDGVENSVLATKAVTVQDTDQTPILQSAGASTVTYVDNGSGGSSVAPSSGITVSDRDNPTLTSATVAVSGNFVPGQDVLSFAGSAATGNIAGAYDAGTGVLTLSSSGGTATLAQWTAALESVQFSEAGQGVSGVRTISFAVSDGIKTSQPVSVTIGVQAAAQQAAGTPDQPTQDQPAAKPVPPPPPALSENSPPPQTADDGGSNVPSVLAELDHPAAVGATPVVPTITFTDSHAERGQFSLDRTSVSAVSLDSSTSTSTSAPFAPQSVVVDYDVSPNHAFVMNLSNLLPTADGMRLNAMSDVTVRLADGRPLPTWLHYDAADGVLTGSLPAGAHDVRVVVQQRDAAGNVVQNEVVLAPSGRHTDHASPHQGHGAHPPAHASRNALAPLVSRDRGQAPLPAGKPSLAQQFAQARAALHVARPAAAAATAAAPAATEHRA
ncbi:DUF4347 domain-containing protein [Trinickia terrae]|uniref:DUF4347 domain-containing protein n=1 Tax=Trinickia terrae TaxID=2571161 RepID=A0A4U1IC99_9BURK|nr:DUF4347 domain-containing protein [Trinickia terrae]TKC91199.1 DUF4347 domain-containing protein [Trinickia terrae]